MSRIRSNAKLASSSCNSPILTVRIRFWLSTNTENGKGHSHAKSLGSRQSVLLTDQKRVLQGRFLHELEDILAKIDRNSHNLGVLRLSLDSYLIEQRDLAPAGGAPSGPEIHHQRPPAKACELGGLAVAVRQGDVRERVGNLLLRRRSRRCGGAAGCLASRCLADSGRPVSASWLQVRYTKNPTRPAATMISPATDLRQGLRILLLVHCGVAGAEATACRTTAANSAASMNPTTRKFRRSVPSVP